MKNLSKYFFGSSYLFFFAFFFSCANQISKFHNVQVLDSGMKASMSIEKNILEKDDSIEVTVKIKNKSPNRFLIAGDDELKYSITKNHSKFKPYDLIYFYFSHDITDPASSKLHPLIIFNPGESKTFKIHLYYDEISDNSNNNMFYLSFSCDYLEINKSDSNEITEDKSSGYVVPPMVFLESEKSIFTKQKLIITLDRDWVPHRNLEK